MFNFFKKRADVIEHWIGFADGFSHSPADFYAAVEKELDARQVPGLEKSRVEFAEGGLLSDKRVYLRMARERLVFDVCAAPFGTRFFFSCRMAEIPLAIGFWQLGAVLLGLLGYTGLLWSIFGKSLGLALLVVTLGCLGYVVRNTVALGFPDLDASLIKSPLLGPLYERFFRRETYYRIDTRLLYLDTVSSVVKRLAEEATAAKGVKLVRQFEQAPILGELFKPVLPRLETAPKG